MKRRILGGTGISVSEYAFGAMMLSQWGNPDHEEGVRMLHTALDAGVNFWDTADMYSNGENEQIVGKALKGRRDDVVLATKGFFRMGDDPNQGGLSRRWLTRALEDSLRRLDTDYVDLYQVHRPDPATDIEETLSVLSDFVRSGKVRAVGSSDFPAEQIVEAQWVAEKRGLVRFRAEQPPYSIFNRAIEAAVLPTAQKYGMGVLTWSPLASGWLSGKYLKPSDVDLSEGRMDVAGAQVRPGAAGERRQVRGDRAAEEDRRRPGPTYDPSGDGVRPGAPGRDVGDHRPAHAGPARRPAGGRRSGAGRRRAGPDR